MTLMPSTVNLQLEATAAPFTAARSSQWRLDRAEAAAAPGLQPTLILSFDVEEHYRIEAAAGLDIDTHLKAHYGRRMELSTWWLLEQLAARDIKATLVNPKSSWTSRLTGSDSPKASSSVSRAPCNRTCGGWSGRARSG